MVEKVCFTVFLCLSACLATLLSEVNGARRQPLDKLILNGPEKLFVFGDSYADTGNWPPTDASRPWREPYGMTFPGKPFSRWSDGRVLTDYIGSPQAYSLWNGDEEVKQYGMNFAYGGTVVTGARRQPQDKFILNGPEKLFVFGDSYADTGNWPPTDASMPWREPYAAYLGIGSPQPYSLWKGDGEAKQYGMNFAYGGTGVFDTYVDGPNMTTQINYLQQLLQQNAYTKHDLTSSAALVSLVGNDYTKYHGNMNEFVDSITKQLCLDLKRIHEMGIPKVAVTAMQPLGCLPFVAFSTGNYPNCDEHSNNITRFHNQMLKQRVDKLNDQTEGSPFVILDLYAAFTSAMNIQHNHPGKSSFPHPLLPCCLGKCGDVDESGKKEYGLCDDPKMAFFWDMAHPSQQGWFAVYSALKSSLPQLFHPQAQQATPVENLGML
nr:GDSL esterase/lipase At5g03610-like [Ipomoea batatas]